MTNTAEETKPPRSSTNPEMSFAADEFAEVILGGSIVIPAAFVFFGPQATTEIAEGGAFNLGFVTMPLMLQKVTFGQIFAFAWFFLLFIAGITSAISLALPAIVLLQDEFNLDRRTASILLAIVTFNLCQVVIFFNGQGALDELDFWGGTFCVVVFATIEVVLFAWVFGMDRAWTELHSGSDIRIPRLYRLVIKYITPPLLALILGFWCIQEGGAGAGAGENTCGECALCDRYSCVTDRSVCSGGVCGS